ncbi:MAG: DNA cytosine methyltransferase [Alphaproteobacteria bacterium]|nr:DNA cytosine methyltransferase [Alphaproteobacteria bacterium]MDA8029849.1 DNA cytosine methyltransferase [Alphaproteobacteria bacterium]
MGLDLGFENAGFRTVYANDIQRYAYDTIRANRPDVPCDMHDIASVPSSRIAGYAGGFDVLIGGPPCQPYSTMGMQRGEDDGRFKAVGEFSRVLGDLQPPWFVFENVPGLVSMRRRPGHKAGRIFLSILRSFEECGYRLDWDILNAADFGAAQLRRRVIVVGSRVSDPTGILRDMPRSHSARPSGRLLPYRTLRDALDGVEEGGPCAKFTKKILQYISHVPPGGDWRDLPPAMAREAMGGAVDSPGGRTGFYRRLSWDRPSPTVLGTVAQKASVMCHPDHDRPLSLYECARLQGFPDGWKFEGTLAQRYMMVGEAVPVMLAAAVARSIRGRI